MAEIFPKDVLLRVGGRTLARYGYLAVAGARKGLVEVPITFSRADATTCATYIDRDGIPRVAAANVPRIEWIDLDGDGIFETPGILLEGSQVNLCDWSDALSNWVSGGTPVVTDNFVTLGSLSLSQVEDDNAAAEETKERAITFTGDGVKGILVFVRAPATPSDGNKNRFRVVDTTAAQTRLTANVTWNSDGTLATATASTGSIITTRRIGSVGGFPVYAIWGQTTSVTAANNHTVECRPTGQGVASDLGKMVMGGVTVVNAAFAGSRIKTAGSTVTRAADSFTVPFNFGPIDITVLARIARPIHADVSGTMGIFPGIFSLGSNATPRCEGYFDSTTRVETAVIKTPGQVTATRNIPAGASITHCATYRNLKTGGLANLDVGAGVSADSAAATAFSAFGNQTASIGFSTGGSDCLFGVLVDLMVARDSHTLAEMLVVP